MPDPVPVGPVSAFPEGRLVVADVGSTRVGVVRLGSEVFAIGNVCPHMGGPVVEGPLSGTIVACPWHGWRFDVTTGEFVRNPNVRVPVHEARIEGDVVLVSATPVE